MIKVKIMQLLKELIRKETGNGFEIQVRPLGHDFGPGYASFYGDVILNEWYVQGNAEYDENHMIVVLYHELGHAVYFQNNPACYKERKSLEDQVQSELAAFEYALIKTLDLAKKGNEGPLKTLIESIHKRKNSTLESKMHQEALKEIIEGSLWQECESYLKILNEKAK